MIQRDRNMQRLGLHCVEELPKPGACRHCTGRLMRWVCLQQKLLVYGSF